MIDVMKDIFNSGSKPFILLGNAAFYWEKLCLLRLLEFEGILLRAEGGGQLAALAGRLSIIPTLLPTEQHDSPAEIKGHRAV